MPRLHHNSFALARLRLWLHRCSGSGGDCKLSCVGGKQSTCSLGQDGLGLLWVDLDLLDTDALIETVLSAGPSIVLPNPSKAN